MGRKGRAMNKRINTVIKRMNQVLEWICIALLAAIVVAAVLQVFTRKVMGSSMVGTEEFARYCFIWMSCMGASLCLTKGSHASIDMLKDKLKGKAKDWHGILCNCIVILVCYVMIRYGFRLLGTVARQSSPTMGIPMHYVYGALPVSCVCMLLSAIAHIANHVVALKTNDKEEVEE